MSLKVLEEIKPVKRISMGPDYEILVVRERRNELVKRLEIDTYIAHVGKGTPRRADIRKAIAQNYGKSEELIVVRKIESEFGIGLSKAEIHIYDDIERLKLFEPKHILKRHEEEKKEGGGE
ncbi:MAG TPA: 30S ribosomal protein S24e [Acidilobales archaeon]|nr:30S ribosomal protein S24e [Acidilobales archaeon]